MGACKTLTRMQCTCPHDKWASTIRIAPALGSTTKSCSNVPISVIFLIIFKKLANISCEPLSMAVATVYSIGATPASIKRRISDTWVPDISSSIRETSTISARVDRRWAWGLPINCRIWSKSPRSMRNSPTSSACWINWLQSASEFSRNSVDGWLMNCIISVASVSCSANVLRSSSKRPWKMACRAINIRWSRLSFSLNVLINWTTIMASRGMFRCMAAHLLYEVSNTVNIVAAKWTGSDVPSVTAILWWCSHLHDSVRKPRSEAISWIIQCMCSSNTVSMSVIGVFSNKLVYNAWS